MVPEPWRSIMSTAFLACTRILPHLLLLTALLLPVACSHVEPWERGMLAKEHMSLQDSGLQSGIRKHTYSSREAAGSTDVSSGGGCGCY